MAIIQLENAAYRQADWQDEIKSKNLLKKGFNKINWQTEVGSYVLKEGSSFDIGGIIYEVDADISIDSGTFQGEIESEAHLASVAYHDGMWVCCSSNGYRPDSDPGTSKIWYSTNGKAWNETTVSVNFSLSCIKYEGGYFWCIGGTHYDPGVGGSVDPQIWRSEDGITWVDKSVNFPTAYNEPPNDITYSPEDDRFVLACSYSERSGVEGSLYYSDNAGTTWNWINIGFIEACYAGVMYYQNLYWLGVYTSKQYVMNRSLTTLTQQHGSVVDQTMGLFVDEDGNVIRYSRDGDASKIHVANFGTSSEIIEYIPDWPYFSAHYEQEDDKVALVGTTYYIPSAPAPGVYISTDKLETFTLNSSLTYGMNSYATDGTNVVGVGDGGKFHQFSILGAKYIYCDGSEVFAAEAEPVFDPTLNGYYLPGAAVDTKAIGYITSDGIVQYGAPVGIQKDVTIVGGTLLMQSGSESPPTFTTEKGTLYLSTDGNLYISRGSLGWSVFDTTTV